jgi:hypothetical protein
VEPLHNNNHESRYVLDSDLVVNQNARKAGHGSSIEQSVHLLRNAHTHDVINKLSNQFSGVYMIPTIRNEKLSYTNHALAYAQTRLHALAPRE